VVLCGVAVDGLMVSILNPIYAIDLELFDFHQIGAVQKEIDGILSTNRIWSRVFCPSGDKISVAGKQLKCLRVP
jgi:hypothetical protein